MTTKVSKSPAVHPTRISLSEETRASVIEVLQKHLFSAIDLTLQCKQAHWNVRGTTFIGLHKLLDEFAVRILGHIDLAAERATALGGVVEGTLRESVKHSRLKKKEEPSSISGMRDWISELADVHAAVGEHTRKAVEKITDAGDFGTADLLTDVLRALDLQLWLLEAHLNQHKS